MAAYIGYPGSVSRVQGGCPGRVSRDPGIPSLDTGMKGMYTGRVSREGILGVQGGYPGSPGRVSWRLGRVSLESREGTQEAREGAVGEYNELAGWPLKTFVVRQQDQ